MIHSKLKSARVEQTIEIGKKIGKNLVGGEVFEMVSDLGGGKTSFVSGLAEGFGSPDPVASPSFTISYVYKRPDGKQLHHFDFYRLQDPGIVANELAEVEGEADVVTVVEWGDIVHNVLPNKRVIVNITAQSETDRLLEFTVPEEFSYLLKGMNS